MLQHDDRFIFDWDHFLQAVVNAINTRLVRIHGFSPAELLYGFQPRHVAELQDFEDEIRGTAVADNIESWIASQVEMDIAAYDARLATIDEIRSEATQRKLADKQKLALKTFRDGKAPQKDDLVLVRRLQQDQQRSHKLEPKWEGPYKVTKTEWHDKSIWVRSLKGEKDKKHHVNDVKKFLVKKFLERKNDDNEGHNWKSAAEANERIRRKVKTWIRDRWTEMKARGVDEEEVGDPDIPRSPSRGQTSSWRFLSRR